MSGPRRTFHELHEYKEISLSELESDLPEKPIGFYLRSQSLTPEIVTYLDAAAAFSVNGLPRITLGQRASMIACESNMSLAATVRSNVSGKIVEHPGYKKLFNAMKHKLSLNLTTKVVDTGSGRVFFAPQKILPRSSKNAESVGRIGK